MNDRIFITKTYYYNDRGQAAHPNIYGPFTEDEAVLVMREFEDELKTSNVGGFAVVDKLATWNSRVRS